MSNLTNKYLDYAGLQYFKSLLDDEYASIRAIEFKGSVEDIAHLPSLASQTVGAMYDVIHGGETTNDFVEGAGHDLADGENVAVVEIITGFTPVDPALVTPDIDPKALGWYENDGVDYIPSNDRIADTTKVYYTPDTVKKWDILGGVFDLEGKYLEFGKEMPENPTDGRVFLYLGEDTYEYNEVPDPTGRPVDQGWYEEVEVYSEVTPVGDENPQSEGWYESDGLIPPTYTLTTDTAVNPSKTYYSMEIEYQLTADVTVVPNKDYFTKDLVLKTGVIYEYDLTEGEWVAKSGGSTDEMIPITTAEIDELFI